jgi:hypothetical protein
LVLSNDIPPYIVSFALRNRKGFHFACDGPHQQASGRILTHPDTGSYGVLSHFAKQPIFFYLPLDCPQPLIQELTGKLDFSLLQGIVIGGALHTGQGDEIGKTGKAPTLEIMRFIKQSAHCCPAL